MIKLTLAAGIVVLVAASTAHADCETDVDPSNMGGIRHIYVYDSSGPGHREGDVVFTSDKEKIVVNGLGLGERLLHPQEGETWQHFATTQHLGQKVAPRMVLTCRITGHIVPPGKVTVRHKPLEGN
jgi:hypothetical protein